MEILQFLIEIVTVEGSSIFILMSLCLECYGSFYSVLRFNSTSFICLLLKLCKMKQNMVFK